MKRLVLSALLAMLPVAAAGGAGPMPTGAMPMGQMMTMISSQDVAALTPLRGRAFDIQYAQFMIPHHRMAVAMAQFALGHATDPRVVQDAQKVIASQNREIALMSSWLRAWGAAVPSATAPYSPEHAPMHMMMPAMSASPLAVERWYLTGMIPHHQGAIDLSRLVPARSSDPQVRQLGQAIIRDQADEIAQYHQWLPTLK